jgi:hypothetical protein
LCGRVAQAITVQSQLRQLLLMLVSPRGMYAEERALLVAAEAFYGVSELALSTGDLVTRSDNAALLHALGKPAKQPGRTPAAVTQSLYYCPAMTAAAELPGCPSWRLTN